MHPVYFVISQRTPNGDEFGMRYGLPNVILDVIECDAADIELIYQERVVPLRSMRPGIQATIYTREPQRWAWRENTATAPDYNASEASE